MVENSTVGVAYSYYTVYNIDDIALCASRTEFDTEAGYGNCIRCYGMIGSEYFMTPPERV